jgi:hypothetical protein
MRSSSFDRRSGSPLLVARAGRRGRRRGPSCGWWSWRYVDGQHAVLPGFADDARGCEYNPAARAKPPRLVRESSLTPVFEEAEIINVLGLDKLGIVKRRSG